MASGMVRPRGLTAQQHKLLWHSKSPSLTSGDSGSPAFMLTSLPVLVPTQKAFHCTPTALRAPAQPGDKGTKERPKFRFVGAPAQQGVAHGTLQEHEVWAAQPALLTRSPVDSGPVFLSRSEPRTGFLGSNCIPVLAPLLARTFLAESAPRGGRYLSFGGGMNEVRSAAWHGQEFTRRHGSLLHSRQWQED